MFDPRARILSALGVALVVAARNEIPPLLLAGAGAALLAALGMRNGAGGTIASLKSVNLFALFFWITLPLTGGGGVPSPEGTRLALLLTMKINILTVVFLRMVVALDPGALGASLRKLGVPAALTSLFLLTFRQIMILEERFASSLRAASLRAPERKGGRGFGVYAAILGSALIHGADRAERSRRAMLCRGGIAGFASARALRWSFKDSLLLCGSLSFAGLILWM